MKDEQVTFNLFDMKPSEEPQEEKYKYRFSNQIDQYLRQDLNNARGICERLINEAGASNERFSTGKPKIYGEVCIYLDKLVNHGNLILIDDNDSDRIYQIGGNESWIMRRNQKMQSN